MRRRSASLGPFGAADCGWRTHTIGVRPVTQSGASRITASSGRGGRLTACVCPRRGVNEWRILGAVAVAAFRRCELLSWIRRFAGWRERASNETTKLLLLQQAGSSYTLSWLEFARGDSSLVRSFACSFVRLLARSLACSFVRSFGSASSCCLPGVVLLVVLLVVVAGAFVCLLACTPVRLAANKPASRQTAQAAGLLHSAAAAAALAAAPPAALTLPPVLPNSSAECADGQAQAADCSRFMLLLLLGVRSVG